MWIGIAVLVLGLAVLAFGVYNLVAARRVAGAPFRKTGELAKNPISDDPQGAMSTEGKVVPPAQPLLSPASKQPCLAYELKIERIYENSVKVNNSYKTVKGTQTLETVRGGTVFGLDDGSGAISVDVSKGADFDNMKEGFRKELNGHGGASRITFGEFSWDVPVIGSSNGWTIGFKATERYVPVEGSLFVLGKLEGASLVKPGWRSMVTSAKGRDGLLGALEKRKKGGLIGGALIAALSIPVMLFGPKGDPDCTPVMTDTQVRCESRVNDVEEFAWDVTTAGTYEVTVDAMPSVSKKAQFNPGLTVTDPKGAAVAKVAGGIGKNAVATVTVQPGRYVMKVFPADHYKAKNGYRFRLAIVSKAASVATR